MPLPKFLAGDRDYAVPLYSSKVVTRHSVLSKADRVKKLTQAGFNVFSLKGEAVAIDLLTDSGTGTLSDLQQSALLRGDESYAGATSFLKLQKTIQEITGLPHVILAHQGRAAEKIQNQVLTLPLVHKERQRYLDELLRGQYQKHVQHTCHAQIFTEKRYQQMNQKLSNIMTFQPPYIPEVYIPGNTHFDTTVGHIEFAHAQPVDLTIPAAKDSARPHPFKGNIDIQKLEKFLADLVQKFSGTPSRRASGAQSNARRRGQTAVDISKVKDHVPFILLTVTCNSGGGQPVSLENIAATSRLAKKYNIPLYLDAARYAENAYFIKLREKPYRNWSIPKIVRKMFSYADGCTMSAKKDAIVPMGGFLALRDRRVYEQMKPIQILFEGFLTYGGISGLMMEAMNQGLQETLDEAYLKDRHENVSYLGKSLKALGIPIVEPIGGHAIFVDARRFYHGIIPEDQFPAQALTAYLYLESGIRGVEIGSCLKGRDPLTGENKPATLDLLRLTIPRRKYHQGHLDAVINALDYLYQNRKQAKGLKIISEPKVGIRHFSAKFEFVK